jgi:hypothetical protein
MYLSAAAASALTFAAVALAAAATQPVTEPATGFSIQAPKDWRVGKFQNIPYPHVATIAPEDGSRANCIVIAEEIAGTKGATQAQLNEQLKTPVGREFWKSMVYKGLTNVVFESDGVRKHPSGVMAQESIAAADGGTGVNAARMKLSSTVLITPGLTYSIACGAREANYEKYRAAFKGVVNSFRLKGQGGSGLSVDANPAMGEAAAVPVANVVVDQGAAFGSAFDGATAAAENRDLVK